MIKFNLQKDKAAIEGSIYDLVQESAWILYSFYRDLKKQNKDIANQFRKEMIDGGEQMFLSNENFMKLLHNMKYEKDPNSKIICEVQKSDFKSTKFDYEGDYKNLLHELIILIHRIYMSIKKQDEEAGQIYKDTLIQNLYIPFDEVDKEDE